MVVLLLVPPTAAPASAPTRIAPAPTAVALAQPAAPVKEEEEEPLGDPSPRARSARKTKASQAKKAGEGKSAGEAKSVLDPPPEVPIDAPPAKKAVPVPGPGSGKPAAPAEKEAAKPPEAADAQPAERREVYDLLYCRPERGPQRTMRIQLCPRILELPLPAKEQFEFPLFLSGPRAVGIYRSLGGEVLRIDYYEERLGELAAEQVGVLLKQLAEPGQALALADDQALAAAEKAEKILGQVIAEHDSAVQRRIRVGPEWNERFRKPLVQARRNLRLGRVDLLVRQARLQQAEVECDRIGAELAPGDFDVAALRVRLEKILQARAQGALASGDYAAVCLHLERFSARYPGSPGPVAQRLQETLVARARQLVREAESLAASAPQKSVELLSQAAVVWPSLAELEPVRRRIVGDYPILRCAYPSLPSDLCPLTARTPADRHALALVCEGLVRVVDDPQIGTHYQSRLAEGRPIPLARGRGFYLPRAKWSDSTDRDVHLCTVEDVRFTVKLLGTPRLPGYSPVYGGLWAGVDNAEGQDPFVALIRLTRDYWQPLSLMDFPILPRHYFLGAGTPEELAERLRQFGQSPLGTGPFRLVRDPKDNPEVRRLVANPHYRLPGLPKIREITFERHEPVKAVELFLEKKVHLIYDVRPEHVSQLTQHGQRVVPLRTPTVWFLAPNHERKLPQNGNLRLAIACAIEREAILTQYFRPGQSTADHAALTGPYPKTAWATNPQVEGCQKAKAKGLAGLAARELGVPLKLRLVYPAGSPEIESACKQIEIQVRQVGITLELKALEAAGYYTRVAESRDFDLAYWSYRYPDATYWIEPLLGADPTADRTGFNVMRYRPDDELAGLLRDVRLHKSFRHLQGLTHRIHEHVARTAIVIPLWQLDTYVAVADVVKDATLDPLVLFGNVEQWRLEPSR
jgi:ABC-type transport system substrate-binding protein